MAGKVACRVCGAKRTRGLPCPCGAQPGKRGPKPKARGYKATGRSIGGPMRKPAAKPQPTNVTPDWALDRSLLPMKPPGRM